MKTTPTIFTVLWTFIIFYLSLVPSSEVAKLSFLKDLPLTLPIDKIVHFTMYFIHSFLLLKAFNNRWLKTLMYTFLISFSLGVCMEFAQTLPFIQRGFEFKDMLFNGLGSLSALWLIWKFESKSAL